MGDRKFEINIEGKIMGARWMQQKLLKQKRMRRAWAKKFSMKNTGPLKNPVVIGDTVNPATGLRSETNVGIKGRSQAAKFWLRPYLLSRYKFDPNSSAAIYARTQGLHSDIAPGSQEIVLARLNQSRNNAGSIQGETQYVSHILKDTQYQYLVLYMGRDISFFIEVRDTESKGTVILTSVEYADRRVAMEAYKGNRILWDEIHYPSTS